MIPLEDLYLNFWRDSRNPPRNLSHLLVRIKRALRIPSHLIEVSWKKENPTLKNKGIYFTTDYSEFEQFLTRAKALERAGEWKFARREFLRAFGLIGGEPFKKMYDFWSEDMRSSILMKLEDEALKFAQIALKHGNKEDATKVLLRMSKIRHSHGTMESLMDLSTN